ncbi:phosphatase PAP2 family protein [Cryobacterium sp. CG_9.6]|uniref:phosphatase PAP2 family protein n=1 Tax=Cryobacterium sp. CG_9.6 TaxID=2760710 RepID=UPI0024757F2C|nr:phosphatase PAP2 family protein [Cryobacterium sp. CG_9.6]MDH6237863.1 undecaprenyl-diphosphatase [Cryobacterium sp. CG_9.6]
MVSIGKADVVEPAMRRKLNGIARALIIVGSGSVTILVVAVLQHTGITAVDEPIRAWLLSVRTPELTVVMITFAILFGPIVLPAIVLIVAATWGVVTKQAWRPLLLAGGMLSGVIVSQIILRLVHRDRPPQALMLFGADPSFSFPSGHVLGASDFLLITTYLVISRRSAFRGAGISFSVAGLGIVAAAISRLYLGYHWTTDAAASVALSLVVLGCVIAVDTAHTVPHAHRNPVSGR